MRHHLTAREQRRAQLRTRRRFVADHKREGCTTGSLEGLA